MIKFGKRSLNRAVWLNYLALCLSMVGIYGFDRGTMRHILMVTAVVALCAAIAFMFADRRRKSADCETQH